ncbi:MAG: NAD(P)-binding domain-containing protein [Pseudomonadota bacterium]
MKIGIIGAGGIGRLYAKRWTDAGHEVVVSSRNPDKLSDFTAETGIRATTAAEAAAFGEAILLAVNYSTLDEALRRIAPHVSGKLLIDATNPLEFVDGAVTRTTPEEELAGVAMAARLPQARVGKAFTSLWAGHVETSGTGGNPPLAMMLSADDEADRKTLSALVRDAGLDPVDLGPLRASRPLDPPSAVWNKPMSASELRAQLHAA